MNTNGSTELNLHFLDYWRVIRIRFPLITLVFLLVVITSAVVTHFLPVEYESKVAIQLKQNDTLLNVFNERGGMAFYDPRFLTTQFDIIQRKEMLYPVIDTLGLEKKWGEKFGPMSRGQAYSRLRGMLAMREVRNTENIEVSVWSTDRREAAEIANCIAEEYVRKRISDQQGFVARSLVQLQDEVSKQRQKVNTLRSEVQRIRIENDIQDLNPDSVEDPMQAADRVLMSVEEMVSKERLRVSALRAKYEQISALTDEQIMRSVTTLEIQDPSIFEIFPRYQESASEEARLLNAGLGVNHPLVKSLRAKKEFMARQLNEQVQSLRTGLAANLRVAEESLKGLETRLNESQSGQQESKTRAAGYYQAKNNYIQAMRVLEAAEMGLSTETMQRTMPQNPAITWDRAEEATFPSRPRVMLNLFLGVVVGLVFGVGLAFFIEYMDTSVKTMEDIEAFLHVPVLGVIPKNISLLVGGMDDNPDAEAYRILRTNIEFTRKTSDANAITIVSGGAGEGKSTTLANLAYTFAKGGYNTLIVDADMRRPSQCRIFGIKNDVGLSHYLAGEADFEKVVHPTKVNSLHLLPSGGCPSDASGLLSSKRMGRLIEDAKDRFDIVLLDSPPILGVSDAAVLVGVVDSAIVVVQHRRFPRAMLKRVKQTVTTAGGTILGVVLNNVDIRHDQDYEYLTNYYNYYQGADADDEGGKAAPPKEKPVAATPPVKNRDAY